MLNRVTQCRNATPIAMSTTDKVVKAEVLLMELRGFAGYQNGLFTHSTESLIAKKKSRREHLFASAIRFGVVPSVRH